MPLFNNIRPDASKTGRERWGIHGENTAPAKAPTDPVEPAPEPESKGKKNGKKNRTLRGAKVTGQNHAMFMRRMKGASGGGSELNIVSAETSQDGTKVIITYDGTPSPFAYDINIMIGGVTDGNLAANIVGNSIEWVVLNTIKTGDVVTVNIMAQGNIGQVNDYPVSNLSIIAAGPLPTATFVSGETDATGRYIYLTCDNNITGTLDKDNFVVSDGFGSGHTVVGADYLDEVVLLDVLPHILFTELTMIVNFVANSNNNLAGILDGPIDNMLPVPAPGDTPLDLDGDGLPDTVIYENGNVTITEDDDSYNVDLDGDGVEDIHVDK